MVSNDDVDVAEVLIDGGADLEAVDGSIGTPLENAIIGVCVLGGRTAARRSRGKGREVVDRGGSAWSSVCVSWSAAASSVPRRCRKGSACVRGRAAACRGVSCSEEGVDHWVPEYASGTPLDTAQGVGTQQENVITWLRELGVWSAQQAE